MNTRKPARILTSSIAALAALAAFSPSIADAASGSWVLNAAGNWGTAANWTPAVVPGTAAGDVITFTNALTAARIVTIDTTSRSAGDLNIGSSAAFGFTLASSAGTVVLNLDGTGAADATVDFTANANTISAPITLVDNGIFRSNIAAVQTLSGIISGAKSVTFNNDTNGTVNAAGSLLGQFAVTGVNTYSLGTTVSDVRVSIQTSAAALGTGAVTIQSGGQVYASTALTFANVFNIAGNGWAETLTGQPFGALRLEGTATISGAVNMTANAGIGGSGTGTGTVSGVISGAGFTLSKRGGTTLVLSGANTYSGGTNVSGILQLNNNAAAGTGAITIDNTTAGGTNTLFATKVVINGGVTITNALNFSGTTGTSGRGILEQTGTGLATMNGAINLTAAPSAGGHFWGGNSASNALVLGGVITSTVQVTQRDGFVRYSGGGTGYNSFGVTGTAQLGATNGISTTAATIVGLSAPNAVLDLNGFDQSLPSISLGNTGASTNSGSIALGARTLTLSGDLSSLNSGAVNVTNAVTATAGGTVSFGGSPSNISVGDSDAPDDLRIAGATITSTGGVSKTGTGTLALSGVTLNGPFIVTAGTVRTGLAGQVGSFTAGNITFNNSTTLAMKVGTLGDSISIGSGTFTNAGSTNLSLNQLGGVLANGTYNLINYTGSTPGTTGFVLQPVGHATATLIDTGTAIALSVTGNDRVIWDGTASTAWTTAATGNWKLESNSNATDYIESDEVIFQDSPTNSTVALAANVSPSKVNFTNTAATSYSVSNGAFGIVGAASVVKTGNGTVTLANANLYTGATDVQAGTLVLNYNSGTARTVLNTASAITVASGATVRAIANDSGFNLLNNISGTGTVELNSHATAGTVAQNVQLGGNNTGFTGTLKLLAPVGGTYRILNAGGTGGIAPASLGGATIEVDSGAQIYAAANQTYTNNISSLSGTGYLDGGVVGNLGALRLEGGTLWSGNIVIAAGGARITSHATTGTAPTTVGTISGNISGGPLEANATPGIANVTGATLVFSGTNSYTTTTIGGSTGGTASSRRLNIGAGGTTGTLGTGAVTLNTDGHNAIIGFDRSDGYTLGAGNDITAAGSTVTRSFVDIETTGTGFSDGGRTINLGGSLFATGGQLRFGLTRAGAIGNFSGNLTTGQVSLGAVVGFGNSTMNVNTGAVINVGTVRVSTAALNNSTINFNGGTFNAFSLGLGEVNSGSGTVNQFAGSTVNIDAQLRVGHFATNTSTYNISGGTLTMTGASPTLTPSTLGAGAANATGDNNINALAVAALVGGGIYIGTDGQGTLNHIGGTVTTNWIVLDNRGASAGGLNMVDGIDRYSISGSSILNLRSNWGLLGRNDGSYAVSLGGGTIRVDNTGTGTGTGANITIPLDAILATVAATTTTLDTNGAGNGFTLTKNTNGTGTLDLTGGGTVNLSTTGLQSLNAGFSGTAALTKLGAGMTDLNGVNSGYGGPVTVSAGRLNVNTALGAASTIAVADGAALSGEPTVAVLTLGVTTGTTLFFNPATSAKLTATTLNAPSNTVLDFSAPLPGDGTYPALSFGSKVGTGTFSLAGGANYRSAVVNESATAVDVVISNTKSLIWNGTGGSTWDVNTTANMEDSGVPGLQEKFFSADVVNFGDTDANGNPITPPTAVTVTAGVSPALVQVSGTTNNYTLTSTGAGIAAGEIVKDGSTTLTLAGPNTYVGKTTVNGGTVSIAAPTSLGSGAPGNSIVLSNGGKLTATAGMDLGVNRNIAVGTGGGVISVSNAAAQTVTVSGNLSGSNALNLNVATGAAGAASIFALSGNNSGYTGAITVDVALASTALNTLRITSQASVPNASSITLNYPAGATVIGNATTLDLASGVNLPAGTTLNMTANLNGTISQRSQITTAGSNVINGPITISGNTGSVVNFSPATAGTTLTLNGNITEGATPFGTAGGPATYGAMLFRSAGNTVVNGQINMPNGMFVRVDNTGTTTVNSTGNIWAFTDIRSSSTLKIGATNALAIAAPLRIGQVDAGNSFFDMNGFNQEVGGLDYIGGNGVNTRGVINNGVAQSTLTINNPTAFIYGSIGANGGGNISGNIAVIKNGVGTQTLQGRINNFTGNVTVNAGTLVAGGDAASTVLGSPTTAGRTVTVNNAGTTLSFTTNNVFGNGVGNLNVPALAINAGVVTSTRYNVLGPISLSGGTLTQSATDAGGYEGFQFRGNVTVGGTAQSVISTGNGKADHLNTNTVFTVADAIAGSTADLLVSAPLRNQSADFASAVGGLTKMGPGTMELSATSAYTGATLITDGVLRVSGSISGSAVTVDGATAVLGGTGTVGATTLLNGGSINPGASPGILSIAGNFTMGIGTTLGAEIDGTTVGAQYDQLSVTGTVTLANATLTLGGAYTYTGIADTFTLILNDGDGITGDSVAGTFAGLPGGASVFNGGQEFTINYAGGDGNDVVLTAVPEPGSAMMLLSGIGMLLGLQRRRRNA